METKMTAKQKEEIAQSLKRECHFLLQVAAIFDERESEALPEAAREQNKVIYNGLMKIRGRILAEYEALIMGEV